MNKINTDSQADVVFTLRWQSDMVEHTDCYHASKVNLWRDHLYPEVYEALMGRELGDQITLDQVTRYPFLSYDPREQLVLKRSQFVPFSGKWKPEGPRMGRFYPRGLLEGVPGVFRSNVQPFRCIGINNGNITADFNHPMAGKGLNIKGLVGKIAPKKAERGGASIDWIETLLDGPGMQARYAGKATDYWIPGAFEREDEEPDENFYRQPRLVQHIDDTATEILENIYGRFLKDGMHVLDLMSSWKSHVPSTINLQRFCGLGMNMKELDKNSLLTERLCQDLNTEKELPYRKESFDAVLNTVSVEYLNDPISIFQEVARVLRPEGYFIVTFSNRWFPTKAIRVWAALHEFERLGLVAEYFHKSGGFDDLHTYSFRGLPRPFHDKYFPERLLSDPVYAVWGRKRD